MNSPISQSQRHLRAPQSQCHLLALSQAIVQCLAQRFRIFFHLLRAAALTVQILRVRDSDIGEEVLDTD